MKLVIVESPKKTVSISKILGSGYIVLGCGGHFMELKDGKNGFYGVDIANNFNPIFHPDPAKTKFIYKIRDAIKSHSIKPDDIYIATDDDREGEAIAWHLANHLNLDLKKAKRMCFHAVTESEVKKALANPSVINQDMVNSALARQITDKVVGYEISPILWRQIGRGLSAGRVQSVVTRLVVDLEKDISGFQSNKFFDIVGTFCIPVGPKTPQKEPSKEQIKAQEIKAHYSIRLESPDEYNKAKSHLESLAKLDPSSYVITSITSNKSQRHPSAPFVTSSLQQESSNRFGWTPKTTMSIAQSLYEKGLITYMRTDSSLLSQEAFDLARVIIEKEWTSLYYQGKQYGTVAKGSQEAHEAIRPTDLNIRSLVAKTDPTPEEVLSQEVLPQEVKLYDLIWKRTIASQMKPQEVLTTTYVISPFTEASTSFKLATKKASVDASTSTLTSTGTTSTNLTNVKLGHFTHKRQQTTFLGFKILYEAIKESDDDLNDAVSTDFPYEMLKQGENLRALEIQASEDITEAAGRYTEASLIRKMEKDGIGRPSTWASMIDKIQEKGYVEKKMVLGKAWQSRILTLTNSKIEEKTVNQKTKTENNKLFPTDLGKIVTKFLEREFTEIMDYKFTADMENELDQVLKGNKVWQDLVRSYWDLLHPKLIVLKTNSVLDMSDTTPNLSTFSASSTPSTSSVSSISSISKVTERSRNERYLGVFPGTTQKIYATIARYGTCIRRDAPDLIVPNITLKPKDKPIIKINPKLITATPTQTSTMPITVSSPGASSAATPIVTSVKPKEPNVTPKTTKFQKSVEKLRAPEYWSVDKNKGQTLESITLEEAIKIIEDDKIFKNGKSLGLHKNITNNTSEVFLKKGRFGPYIQFDNKTKSISESEAETMTLEKAIAIFEQEGLKGIKRHIENLGDLVTGRYGSYLKLATGKNVNLKQLKVSEEAFMALSDADIQKLVENLPTPDSSISFKRGKKGPNQEVDPNQIKPKITPKIVTKIVPKAVISPKTVITPKIVPKIIKK